MLESASAWARLRGKPSSTKPRAASGSLSRSRMMPITISSSTSAPASMAALARSPSAVPRATAERSRSPVEICGTPKRVTSRCAWVPLPEPGAPRRTIRICNRRYRCAQIRVNTRCRKHCAFGYPDGLLTAFPGARIHMSSQLPATPSMPSRAASPRSSTPRPAGVIEAAMQGIRGTSEGCTRDAMASSGVLTEDLIDVGRRVPRHHQGAASTRRPAPSVRRASSSRDWSRTAPSTSA